MSVMIDINTGKPLEKPNLLDYFNQYGLVQNQKGVETENGILFRAILDNWDLRQYDIIKWDGWQRAIAATIVDGANFQANPPQQGKHFSRYNMLGLFCLCKIHEMKQTLRLLPVMYWNGKINWHPNTWAVFLAIKYPIFKLNPIIYIMALYSLLATDYKNTSGKNLWFLTLTTLNVTWPLRLAQWRYRKFNPVMARELFEFSHEYYFSKEYQFNNADHPIRTVVREYYKKERAF